MKPLEEIELFGPQMLEDPYPIYKRLQEEEPVYWDKKTEGWYFSHYQDVVLGLTDSRFSADRASYMEKKAGRQELASFFSFLSKRMLFNDPPAHTRLRNLVSQAFKPHIVEAMGTHIQDLVNGFLDRVQAQGNMEIVGDLAFPLPASVIAELLGIPPEDRNQVREWSDDFATFFAKPPASETTADYQKSLQGAENLKKYLRQFVQRMNHHPQNNLLSILNQAEEAGDKLTEDELFSNAILILVAGHETTTSLITNGMLALLQNPEQFQKLKEDPSGIPYAVEEFLRYDSPVQFTYRIAHDDMEIGGKSIRKGQMVHLLIGAANRDPKQFPNPDKLDLGRWPNHHVSFGMGAHFCLGAALARLEAKIAFRTMLNRMPNMRLASKSWTYRDSPNLRRLIALPVIF